MTGTWRAAKDTPSRVQCPADIAGSAVVELDGDGKAQPLTEWSNFMEWRKDPLGSKVLEILRAEGEVGRMPVVPDNDMTRLFLDSMPINSMSVLMGADASRSSNTCLRSTLNSASSFVGFKA